jgi:hypothetical protein
MLHEEVEDSDFVAFQLGELPHDGVGYEVAASGLWGEGEGLLEPGHGWSGRGWRERGWGWEEVKDWVDGRVEDEVEKVWEETNGEEEDDEQSESWRVC